MGFYLMYNVSMTQLSEETYYQQTFSKLILTGETIGVKTFEECVFDDCRFIDGVFDNTRFLNCRFNGCVISAVKLTGCRLIEPVFSNGKVIGIDWTRVVLLKEPKFYGCQLNYSNFRMLKIPKTKMINCEAKEIEFAETDFTGAVFTGSDFEKSRFFKTNLTGVDFRGAKNYSIDITNNTIKKAKFSYPEVVSLLNYLDIIIE
jgi:fluoroquinolone resistance protein